jgi:NADH:ubiquinone oxidoreductase subunit 3 (subunit A)
LALANDELYEIIIAFTLILAISIIIYLIAQRLSPKSIPSVDRDASYACGERVTFGHLTLNVTSSRYLVFFLIIDSSVTLIAFAAMANGVMISPLFVLYLIILLIAVFLLNGGNKK